MACCTLAHDLISLGHPTPSHEHVLELWNGECVNANVLLLLLLLFQGWCEHALSQLDAYVHMN